MTQIKLTTALGGNKIGETITTTNGAATFLVTEGYAEHIKQAKPQTKGKAKTTTQPAADTEGGGASPARKANTAG